MRTEAKRLAIPTQRPNHPRPTHPQLPYLDDSALESWGVKQKVTAAFLDKKKSAREEHSISLALGGARSSTPSLHHPWQGASRLTARQLVTICDVDQGGSPMPSARPFRSLSDVVLIQERLSRGCGR